MRFALTIVAVVSLSQFAPAQQPGGYPTGGATQFGQPGMSGPAAPPSNTLFDAIDADGDGEITSRELRKAVVALKQFDTDKDGKITRDEVSGGPPNPQAAISRLLENDKDGDGKLSKSELPRHLAQSLKTADTNGDGALDRTELGNVIGGTQPQLSPTAAAAAGTGFRGRAGFNVDPRPGVNLSQFDRNGDGQLSADEVPAEMRGALRGTDQNGDGKLSPQELQMIQQRMNERLRGQRPLPPGVTVGPQGVSGTPQKP